MIPIAKGYVISVGRKRFWCRLKIRGKDYDAEVEIAKLSDRERPLLCEGAYIMLLKGGSWRFLRLKPLTKKEIKAARKKGAELAKAIGWS